LKTKRKTLDQKTWKKLIKILDDEYSLYIRRRDKFKCVCCGKKGFEKDGVMDNGHYFGRAHFSVRYNDDNCHCQCKKCNYTHTIDKTKYTIALLNKIGKDRFEKLSIKANHSGNFTRYDLITMIKYYRKINQEYETKKQIW